MSSVFGPDRRFRIVHVSHSGVIGGSPYMLFALAKHFSQGQWESTVICSDDGPLGVDLESIGVKVVRVPMDTQARALAAIPRMARTIRGGKPDLVHLHSQFAGFAGGIAARLGGFSNIVYKAAFPSFLTDWGLMRSARNYVAEKGSCLCARHVVCVSEHDRQEFLRRRLVGADRCSVIYSGADPDRFRTPPTRPPDSGLRPPGLHHLIGFAGRLKDQKGLEVLLKAMPIILRELPDTALLVAGEGQLSGSLQQLTVALGLGNVVRFLGPRRDIPAIMAEIDVLAVPSLFEPFGIVAVEGMDAGKPVVASRVGGLQEIVVDGQTGWLVEPGDVEALAGAIIRTLSDRGRAEAMGRAGAERATTRFSIDTMCAAYEALYLRLLGAPGAPRV